MEEAIKLRALGTADLFLMSRIIGKIGPSNFKKCFNNDELKSLVKTLSGENKSADETLTAVGITAAFDVAGVLFEHLPECENELYQFLANLAGLKPQDIKNQSPATTLEMIIEVIQKPEFKDFFKVASRLFKSTKMK